MDCFAAQLHCISHRSTLLAFTLDNRILPGLGSDAEPSRTNRGLDGSPALPSTLISRVAPCRRLSMPHVLAPVCRAAPACVRRPCGSAAGQALKCGGAGGAACPAARKAETSALDFRGFRLAASLPATCTACGAAWWGRCTRDQFLGAPRSKSTRRGSVAALSPTRRRYVWRDLVALRRAHAKPSAEQPTLFPRRDDCRPAGERNAAERYREPSLFTRLEREE
jgi:hypothetical protein